MSDVIVSARTYRHDHEGRVILSMGTTIALHMAGWSSTDMRGDSHGQPTRLTLDGASLTLIPMARQGDDLWLVTEIVPPVDVPEPVTWLRTLLRVLGAVEE